VPDIIELLPDSVANQIAAGEVIQRPASVAKELLENSVDAGATDIKLIIKDAGKTLIQVIDNGCGMSETDARMCFERHATSKIRKADDLFAIRTKGFRGEAMASIAAIAHVDIKTRRTEDEIATKVEIEATTVKSHEPVSAPAGTSTSVKTLFFNIPARRKFLKSNHVETRHIIDEFQRVAMPHPDISMSMHHNGSELFHLPQGSLRQRIVGIFGKNHNQKLVPVEEVTNIVSISGFIGKPEFAKKTRGEQFFFVNKRFIRNPYLHHAVVAAFDELIPKDQHPSYFLLMDIAPEQIDINIHPTKTEIKFEDEKSVYAIVRSAVRQSLGKYNVAPTLDFEREAAFDISPLKKGESVKVPNISIDPDYNPFGNADKSEQKSKTVPSQFAMTGLEKTNKKGWEKLYENFEIDTPVEQQIISPEWDDSEESDEQKPIQLHNKYILSNIKSGVMLIHQQRAHERVLYEKFIAALAQNSGHSQQLLFPQTVELSAGDFEIIKEIEEGIKMLGFDFREFGKNTFVVDGVPSEMAEEDAKDLLENIIESYKQNNSSIKFSQMECVAKSLALKSSVGNKKLKADEMSGLIDALFACEIPHSSPSGKPTLITITLDDLEKRFQ